MKRILYFAPGDPQPNLAQSLAPKRADPLRFEFKRRKQPFEWATVCSADDARAVLAAEYVNLLVVDLRDVGGQLTHSERIVAGLDLLDALDHPADPEIRYGFHRIVTLVSGKDPDNVDRLIKRLGALGVGRVLRDRTNDSAEFAERVRRCAVDLVLDRRLGKTALAASGGGITGIFFEQGALKCLDDVFGSVNDFDMYFGISAGAVVTSVIAAGYSVDEFMAAVARHPGGRIAPLDLRLVRLSHLNLPDIGRRMTSVAKATLWGAASLLREREAPSLNNMVLDYSAIVGPPFRSDEFEEILRTILTSEGLSNDFRRLGRDLFIGASDQDARQHVLFGAEGWDTVPISKAVQASMSVHPAFSAVEIDGRFYEDGAVTRTSDFVEAIQRGADLVFVLDPFVPYVSKNPGATNRRGVLYNIDQDVRSLSYTRYANTRDWVLRKHPNVSSYTFLPSNRTRRILSRNPMDHRPYLEIWRGAYLSTYERLKRLQHRLRGDIHVHGIPFEMDRADEVARRLKRSPSLKFSDFFPDGRVELKLPPIT